LRYRGFVGIGDGVDGLFGGRQSDFARNVGNMMAFR
jgi:hypothetical protein